MCVPIALFAAASRRGVIVLLALLAACAPDSGTSAATLRYASSYPPQHPFSQADIAWMKHVEEKSGGRLKIKPFWGGTLVSNDNSVLELSHGVADIAQVAPIYTRAGMKAIKIQAGFYWAAYTPSEQAAVYKCLARRYRVLTEEMAGVHVLAIQGGALLHVLTRDRPVQRMADLRGLRLRTPYEIAPLLRAVGAQPVTMPMGEVYSALSKGVIDGVVTSGDTLRTMHFSEVVRHTSMFVVPRGAYPARAISNRAWNELPPDLQTVLAEAQPYWEAQLEVKITAAEAAGIEFGKSHGQIFTVPSEAEQDAFDKLYNAKSLEHAETLENDYADGVAMFKDAQGFIGEIRAGRPAC